MEDKEKGDAWSENRSCDGLCVICLTSQEFSGKAERASWVIQANTGKESTAQEKTCLG